MSLFAGGVWPVAAGLARDRARRRPPGALRGGHRHEHRITGPRPRRWGGRLRTRRSEAFSFPAYTALPPTILLSDELPAANGVEGALRPVAVRALGPAPAGLLVGAFAPATALLAAGGLYALEWAALLGMRTVPVPVAPTEGASVLHDLLEGVAYVSRTGWLFATLAFATHYARVLIGPMEALLPFAVRDQTGSGALWGVGAAPVAPSVPPTGCG